MHNRLLRTALGLLAASLFWLGSAPSAGTADPAGVATCPAGTHWDSVTQTCR